MKYIYFLIIVVTAIITSSCARITMRIFGVKPVRVVTAEQITNESSKLGFQYHKSLSLSQDGFMKWAEEEGSANSLFIYDKEGHQIIPLDSVTCSSDLSRFSEYFRDTTRTKLIPLNDSNYFHSFLVNLDGSSANLESEKPYQAIIFWAYFGGKQLNSTSVEQSQTLFNTEDTDVIIVAIDPRDFWPDAEEFKPKTTFKRQQD